MGSSGGNSANEGVVRIHGINRTAAFVASAPRRLAPFAARIASFRAWLRLAIPAAVGAVLRCVYVLVLTDPSGVRSDAAHYNEIATNLANGLGFVSRYPQLELHDTAFRPPVYPFILSMLYRVLGPNVAAGKLLNVALGIGVVVCVQLVVGQMAGVAAGFVSAVAVACSPTLIANDSVLLAETIGLLLLLGLAYFGSTGRAVSFGVCAGLLVLTKPTGQAIAVTALIWLAWTFGWRRSGTALATTALVVMPWYARTVVDVGTTSLYTSNGFNVAAIYSPESQESGQFVDPTNDPRYEGWRLVQFDEGRWASELFDHGLSGLRSNPGYAVENSIRNTAATFEIWPPYNTGPEREDGRNLQFRAATLPLFYVALVVGTIGLVRWRRRRLVQLLLVAVVTNLLVCVVLLSPPRLRSPLDLALAIGIGLAMADPSATEGDARAGSERPGPGEDSALAGIGTRRHRPVGRAARPSV